MRLRTRGALLGASGLVAGTLAFWPAVAQAAGPFTIGCGPGTVTTLQTDIGLLNADSGGTINLAANCAYTVTDSDVTSVNAMPVITEPITIIGSNTTIERSSTASESFRIFEVGSGGSLTMRGVTVANGHIDGAGGCYYVDGDSGLMLMRSPVRGCTATGNGGGIYVQGGFGAPARGIGRDDIPYVVYIEKTSLVRNTAANGGAIYGDTGSMIAVEQDFFGGNTANDGDGGAVYSAGIAMPVDSSFFKLNTATAYGGGIFDDSSDMGIYGSTLMQNRAARGGGIYNAAGQPPAAERDQWLITVPLYMQNTLITANRATDAGGGIYQAFGDTTLLHVSSVSGNIPNNCRPLGSVTNCFN